MRAQVIPWSEEAPPSEADLRQRLEDEGYNVFYYEDKPHADYHPHSHAQDQTLWLIAGEMTLGIAGKQHRLKPGDRVHLPRGLLHTAHAGASGATYLIGEMP